MTTSQTPSSTVTTRQSSFYERSSKHVAQKTRSPPQITPKRTAPPVARMLAERPAAPPLLPPELELVLEGDVVPDLVPETEEAGRDEPLEAGVDAGVEDPPEAGTLEEEATKKSADEARRTKWATYSRKAETGSPVPGQHPQRYTGTRDIGQRLPGIGCWCKRNWRRC